MKVLNKIESIIIYMVLGIVLATSSIVGMFELLYCSVDMYYEQAMWLTVLYAIVIIYWVIKKIVFKTISIIRH